MQVINGVNLFPDFIGHPLVGIYELLNGNSGPASFTLAPLYTSQIYTIYALVSIFIFVDFQYIFLSPHGFLFNHVLHPFNSTRFLENEEKAHRCKSATHEQQTQNRF